MINEEKAEVLPVTIRIEQCKVHNMPMAMPGGCPGCVVGYIVGELRSAADTLEVKGSPDQSKETLKACETYGKSLLRVVADQLSQGAMHFITRPAPSPPFSESMTYLAVVLILLPFRMAAIGFFLALNWEWFFRPVFGGPLLSPIYAAGIFIVLRSIAVGFGPASVSPPAHERTRVHVVDFLKTMLGIAITFALTYAIHRFISH
jgi:hypothetical protein